MPSPARLAPACPCVPERARPDVVRVRRRWRRTTSAGLACLAALASLACRQPAAESASVTSAPLTIGLTSAGGDVRILVRSLTTTTLVGTSPDGRPTPGLLQSWTVTPDGLQWEFAVRPGIVQHDGTPVRAADVVARIEDQLEYDVPPGLLDVEAVEVVGDLRLRVRLRAPSSLLLEALTLTRAVPAGPFLPPEEPVTNTSSPTLLGRTLPDGTPPRVSRVIFRRYDSPRSAWAALMRDEIDLLHEVSSDARSFLERTPGIEVRPFLRPFIITLGVNLRHPALRPTAVRLALNHAIDRTELLTRDLGGHGQIATSHVSPRHWAADATLAPYSYDPALATRLLDDAGLALRAATERGPARVRLSCLVLNDQPRYERVALRVQRSLAAVGIDVRLEPVSSLDVLPRLENGQFDLYLLPVVSGYGLNLVYQMWGREYRGQFARHGYTAAEDALLQMRRAPSDAAFVEALREVQHVLHDDPPAVFLAWDETARAVGRRFVVPPSFGRDILSTIAQWRPRPPAGEAGP